MKRLSIISLMFVVACSVLSCEKVIDVDLNASAPNCVIEGIVTDEAGGCRVLISKTKNFDEDNQFEGVSGAEVSISENGGASQLLAEVNPGDYQLGSFHGSSGNEYSLTVVVGSQTYSATCRMPVKVGFDSLYITDELLFTDLTKVANVKFSDPPQKGNCYRFVQYFNAVREQQLQVTNDDYTNGRTVTAKLFYFSDDDADSSTIHSGDQVRVEMQCIDPAIYKYWFSLSRSATGLSGQATPANPVSNIQGGALGYFSAQTVQRRTVTAP